MEPTTKTNGGTASIIAAGTEITGNIKCDGDIRIDGLLKGNVHSGSKVILGPDGKIQGDIEAKQADVMGKVSGKIVVTDLLNLKGKAEVDGDIYTGQLQVEPSASFNGSCHMGKAAVAKSGSNALKNEPGSTPYVNKPPENVLAG
ncbi:MAG: polymer-forming cytoskeletal protein [Sphingobacteriales bacterium]|nr:polymer-forming cytoskeletal protein [Sphingobacteriales bacterium]MBI3718955.1 polymer-forming cytoskeletal protein [Sphingobacteriales bacterium]